MGLIMTRMLRLLWRKEEYKIVIVGLDNAGKTTILYRLFMNQVIATTPTIGSNVEEWTYKNIHLKCWDLGGQTSLRPTWSTYYVNTRAVILVVDSTDTARLPVSASELATMMEQETLRKASLLVYANKQDVKGAMTAARISEALKLAQLKDRQWHIQACCAVTGDGLFEGLDWVVSQLTSNGAP